MAEILLMAVNKSHSNPTKDLAGCYKIGDPVIVRDDGHTWGSQEFNPPVNGGSFVVLKITNVTRAQVERFIQIDKDGDGKDRRRRLYRVVWSELPTNVRNQMITTGTYSTTWSAVRNFIENKVTLARESGNP